MPIADYQVNMKKININTWKLYRWYGLIPSKAEQTIYWFICGKKWEAISPPMTYNCRCIMLNGKFGK